jgi:hypothetical protein
VYLRYTVCDSDVMNADVSVQVSDAGWWGTVHRDALHRVGGWWVVEWVRRMYRKQQQNKAPIWGINALG